MKTAIQQCAEDLLQTDLSHEVKIKIIDILHTHLTTEKKQIIEANEKGLSSMGFQTADFKYGTKYYENTFSD